MLSFIQDSCDLYSAQQNVARLTSEIAAQRSENERLRAALLSIDDGCSSVGELQQIAHRTLFPADT